MPVPVVTIKPTVAELMPLERNLLILRKNIFSWSWCYSSWKRAESAKEFKQVLKPWTVI